MRLVRCVCVPGGYWYYLVVDSLDGWVDWKTTTAVKKGI